MKSNESHLTVKKMGKGKGKRVEKFFLQNGVQQAEIVFANAIDRFSQTHSNFCTFFLSLFLRSSSLVNGSFTSNQGAACTRAVSFCRNSLQFLVFISTVSQ